MKRRVLGLAALALFLVIALGPGPASPSVSAATTNPSVTVSKTSGLVDGDNVTVSIKSSIDVPVYSARAQLCRAGVTYPAGPTLSLAFASDGPNCFGPTHPISTSAIQTLVVDTNTLTNASTPDGETFLFQIGSGVVNWIDATTANPVTLTCDTRSPCALVVYIAVVPSVGAPIEWRPFVFTISYGEGDPIASCGGPATGALTTGGSDRISEAYVNLTLGACALPGAHGAPTRASFSGEGNAVQTFALGGLDLAYTAGGYDDAMNLAPPFDTAAPNGGRRGAVAIPIALNGAVLSAGGGRVVDSSHKVPYKNIELTDAELAAFLSGGRSAVVSHRDAILQRNPELAQTDLYDSNLSLGIGAYADAEASSWYLTRFMQQIVPGDWKVPNIPTFGADAGRSRGVDASLALADPSYIQAVALVSGRPSLRKGLCCSTPASQGAVWVFTDLQTANALNLTPVQIQTDPSSTTFVAPTAASLLAAVPTMHEDSQGILISDPAATAPQNGVSPYPLTMVEYALVPTEPLLNEDCSARNASQQLLHDWLTYITSVDGQAKLPAGMVPLPAELRTQAAQRIEQVGAAAVTGTCAPKMPLPTSDNSPLNGGSFANGSSFNAGSLHPITNAAVAPVSSASDAPPGAATEPADQLVSIPAYAGRSTTDSTSAIVALIGLMGLTSAVALASSKFR